VTGSPRICGCRRPSRTSIIAALVVSTARCSKSSPRENGSRPTPILALVGPTGVGKSWLASALGHKACRDDRSVLYRVPKLFEDLTRARGDGRHPRILRSLGHTDLLILDDWDWSRSTPPPVTTSSKSYGADYCWLCRHAVENCRRFRSRHDDHHHAWLVVSLFASKYHCRTLSLFR
jgi:hypothetical protein